MGIDLQLNDKDNDDSLSIFSLSSYSADVYLSERFIY